MKKIYSLLFIVVTVSFTGCFELERIDPNSQNEDSYWTTEEHFYKGIISAYNVMQTAYYQSDLPLIFTGMSDDGKLTAGATADIRLTSFS